MYLFNFNVCIKDLSLHSLPSTQSKGKPTFHQGVFSIQPKRFNKISFSWFMFLCELFFYRERKISPTTLVLMTDFMRIDWCSTSVSVIMRLVRDGRLRERMRSCDVPWPPSLRSVAPALSNSQQQTPPPSGTNINFN